MADRKILVAKAWRALTSLPFLMLLGFWVSYLLLGYFAVNPVAQRLLPWVAENKLDSRLQVERVDFDPLRLAVTVSQLKLTTPEGASLAGFERLHADLELSGLFRFAWRLKDIRLAAPHVSFEVLPGGTSNWAALIARLNENPDEPKSEGMARLLVDHILIERGDVEYIDRNRPETFRAVLQPLGLELDGFSTLPEDLGDYAILAKLPEQGGTLKWKGELGLNPVVSSGKVELEGLKLAKLLEVLPPGTLPLRLDAGQLRTRLDYQFAIVQDQPEATISHFSLALDDAAATLLQSQAQQGKLALKQLAVELPSLQFKMQEQAKMQVQFDALKLSLDGIRLSQQDKTLLALPSVIVDQVGLDLQAHQLDIGSLALVQGEVKAVRRGDGGVNWQQVHVATEAAEQPEAVEGELPASPWNIQLHQASIDGLKIDYLDETFKQPLQVAVDSLSLKLKFASEQGQGRLDDIESTIGPFSVRSGSAGKPVAHLERLALQGGQVDLAGQKASLDAVIAQGLGADVLRDAKQVNWQAILAPAQPTAIKQPHQAPGKTAPAKPAEQASSPWTFDLKRLAVQGAGLHFSDQSAKTPVALDIEQASLEVKDVSLDTKRALPVSLAFKVRQGGSFTASGKLAPEPMAGELSLKLAAFSLKPFAPYVNQFAMLKLNNGAVSTQGKLSLKQGQQLAVQYQGGFSVDQLDIVEEDTGQAFLGWRSLSTNSLKLALAPDSLHISELKVNQPRGKFIIYEDRTLNVKRILREQPSAAAQAAPTQASAPAADPFPVAIERIRIDNANLEFADLSLTPQFGTHINSLSGVINGMSTQPTTTAQVELDGKVDDYGSARIRGSVQPFQATEFTDLKLIFRNLEMNRLTPYSGKFAGRRIDSGKLSVDLEYKIKNRQLAGANKFIVNKLKLGEKVASEDAVNLPLDLAIALLEDSNGIIDLDLPVAGSLDDPEFSYGKIVWKAIVNVLGKLVTSPFRALGNLLGISSDKLEALVFDPGSAELAPPEQEKLKVISEALSKRPALVLQVAPVVNDKADARALQEQLVRKQVAEKTGLKLQASEQPGPVDTHNKKVRSALDKLAREQLTPEAQQAIKAEKDEALHYDKLLEALNQQAKLPSAWPETLGQARQEAIQHYLQTLALDAGKVQFKPLNRQSGAEGEVKLPLALSVERKD